MLEYFFSCTVVGPSATERTDEYSPEPTSDASEAQVLNPDCPLFTHNLLREPAIIQFLSERVQKNPVFKDQLLEVVERSKADASIATAAASAMTILVRAGVIFHRYDFRGVRIPGADLSGGQFDSAQFQGANLTNVNLGMTWLRNADFSNAQMDGVQFGELPYLEVEEYAYACCHSPDGKTLALGLTGGRIELYDTETWEKTGQAKHGRDITSLAYSPDGQRLVSGSEDNIVRVWDCANSDPIFLLDGHTKEVESVAFSPCGKKVASASQDETVRLWDSTTGEVLHVLRGHEDFVNCVRFTPDGRQLVSGSVDDTIRFWDVETGAAGEVWEMDEGTVICLAISPDGRQVVIGHGNGAIRVWSIATRSAGPVLLGNTQETRCVIFSADGQRIASAGYDSTARVWDSTTGTPISVFNSTGLVYDVSFSLDGRNLVSVDASIEIRLWDTRSSGYSMGQLGHCDTVRSVAYQPSGQFILSGSNDGTVRQWDALTGAAGSISVIKDLADTLYSITLSPDLNKAATGSDDGFIEIWDLRSNERGPDLEGHTDDVMELAFSPCNGWIASASEDKTVRLWDMRNGGQGQVLCEMPADSDTEEDDSSADSDNPFELAFSPTGSQLAVGDWNGTVNVYDIQTRAVLTTTTLDDDAVFSLAYSPNGQELAIGIDGAILFWDLQSKEPGDKLKLNDYGVHPIVYSPCGEWIACGDGYCGLQLCRRQSSEKNTWRCVSVIKGFLMEVMAIAWNPVVPLEFVTGSQDRSIRVWRISDSNDDGVVSVEMVWGSNVGVLGASGMRIDDVIGLDAESRRLLIQRGAVDGNSVSKENESNPSSGGVVKAGDGKESDDGEEETDDDEEDTDDEEDDTDDEEEETDDGEE
ncbi:WD40 repeat-like protein [Linnemannia elongata AG-77]|uniref:WD40 repeat-like protein n=1 Tax=Linnemannia elongata AG-77 TaxID=1314771 RepID=A0A197KGK7_9FUNG|nr:WD40 repeat-like protein [Linnemannia elongata AG-77]